MRVLFALLALAVTVSAQGTTGPNFYIVGVEGNVESYLFSINGVNVPDPSFNFTVGTTYKYVLNATLPNHPFGFSLDNTATTPVPMSNFTAADQGGMTLSGSCANGANGNLLSWVTTDAANPCIISITPPANAVSAVYYRCSNHPNMIGTLSPAAGGSGSTTSPPTGTTTSPPTGTTTQTPTTPAPTGSSTGKNSAAIIVPSATTAFIIAAISALFSA